MEKLPPSRWALPAIAVIVASGYIASSLAYDWLESNGHPPGMIAAVLAGSFAAAFAAAVLVWLLARRRFRIAYALLGAFAAFPIVWLVIPLANGQGWHHRNWISVVPAIPLLAIAIIRSQRSRRLGGEVPRPPAMAKSWSRRG